MSQNDNVWVVAFLCESFFTFIWLLITCIKWTPAEHKPYPDRLDERYHSIYMHTKSIYAYQFLYKDLGL